MSEPVYFAVVSQHGRLSPRRFFEAVPRCYGEKSRKQELVYVTRIDTKPNGDTLINVPLDQLMTIYHHMSRMNTLPVQEGRP